MPALIIFLILTASFFFLFLIGYDRNKRNKHIRIRENFTEDIEKLKEELKENDLDMDITFYNPISDEGRMTGESYEVKLKINESESFEAYEEVDVCDESFDEFCTLKASGQRRSIAALNYKIRSVFKNTFQNSTSIEINDNSIRIISLYGDKIVKKELYEAFIDYYKRINDPENINRYLKENILNDPDEDVRINNMDYFLDSDDFKMDRDFFRSLVNDKNIDLRFTALSALQDEYADEIIQIFDTARRDIWLLLIDYIYEWEIADKIKMYFYKIFSEEFDTDKILSLLDFMMIQKDEKSIESVLKFTKNHSVLIDSSYDIISKLIKFFKSIKTGQGVNWLAEYLYDNDVRLDVIDALKNIGDLSAVEYLMPFTKGLNPSDIKIAAQDAINHLQKNIDVSEKGILTLMETEAGNLSIDESGESGKLTIEE